MNTTLRRLPLFALGAASLLAGLLAGLGRLGWTDALGRLGPSADLMLVHGPLMVCGFFGTVIGLERAVALGRPWGYGAPALTAASGLLLMLGQVPAAALAATLGSLVFAAMAVSVVRRQPEAFTTVLALGGAAWVAGNLLWLAGVPVGEAVPLWAAFLVLTIAGERLELSRFLPPWRWRIPTLAPTLVLVVGAAPMPALGFQSGWTVFGLGLVAQVAWSLRNDVVRRTVRQPGLTRYVAICLLSGYAWLAVAGTLMLGLGAGEAGPRFDAALHALFVGFVFAMVFGHAPVILPAVLKVAVPWRRYFYLPLTVLHASLILRLAGDLAGLHPLRQWGGLANAAAILLFLATMLGTVITAKRG